MHSSALVFAVAALVPPATGLAQGAVRVVGPGGFASIAQALAACAPGDIVEVASGSYAAFDCSVGVTIRAATPGTVVIVLDGGLFVPNGYSMLMQVPAGQMLHLAGLEFRYPTGSAPSALPALQLRGVVALESCTLRAAPGLGSGRGALRIDPGAVVHLQDVVTDGPAVLVDGKTSAVQCDFRGFGTLGFSVPTVRVTDRLQASHCRFEGGSSSFQTATAALQVGAGASAWVTDSTLERGPLGLFACPLANLGGTVELVRCTSATPACLPGPALAGLGVQRSGPVVTGGVFAIGYRTEPFHPVGVHASFELGDVGLPFLAQPWSAPLGGSFDVGLGFGDATGAVGFAWAIPANPTLVGLALWLHGFSGLALPLQVAPAVGGVVR
ncbi:MAG: hypothetical protein WAT39_21630 [Planctomycetota bacterium]